MTAAAAAPVEIQSAVEQARAQMFETFVAALNGSRIRYCFLSGFRQDAWSDPSDVDFMVHPQDAERIAPMLAEVARRAKAQMVQAIQHETGAWYFALAKQIGSEVAYLHPDCTTDYRRQGRLWLKAEEVLARRRPQGAMFVPAAADEFVYYLVKKVLKQSINAGQIRRLRLFYAAAPSESGEGLQRFWQSRTADAVTAALLRSDVEWMKRQMATLLAELLASRRPESAIQRGAHEVHEWRRWTARVCRPTGACVTIYGPDPRRREELAAALLENLCPAFRRAFITDRPARRFCPDEWPARVRSTLILRSIAKHSTSTLQRTCSEFAVNSDEYDAELATRTVLAWLERRTVGRIGQTESAPRS